MTQFEQCSIALGMFALAFQVISVLHPLIRDVLEWFSNPSARSRTRFVKDAHMNKYGERLLQERHQSGWTQQQVADKLYALHSDRDTQGSKRELAPCASTVGRWERGTQVPSRLYRMLLCQLFEMSEEEVTFLLEDSGHFQSVVPPYTDNGSARAHHNRKED